jgi:hypothetical protein
MKHRITCLVALLLLGALSAQAQFVGDAMAGAGFAELEGELGGAGLAAVAGQGPYGVAPSPTAPQYSQNVSNPQLSTNVSTPQWTPSGVSAPQQTTYSVTPSGGGEAAPAPSGAAPTVMPGGNAYGIASSGRMPTPAEAAEWKSAFRPVGSTIKTPPPDSETISSGVRYSKGVFYQQRGDEWVVVPAPEGAKVKDRPAGASLVVARETPYQYYNGAFFFWNQHEKLAEVVAAPQGAIVTNIPESASKQSRDGKVCYVYGDTCFAPSFRGSNVVYVVQ